MGQKSKGSVPATPTKTERRFRRLLAEQVKSGKTGAAFARERDVPVTALTWWRHEVARRERVRAARERRQASASLLPVQLVAPVIGPPILLEVVLRSGRVLRVPPGVDVARIRAVAEALE